MLEVATPQSQPTSPLEAEFYLSKLRFKDGAGNKILCGRIQRTWQRERERERQRESGTERDGRVLFGATMH